MPEQGGMIPVLWQSPFRFTDGVILTLTKRGLSQPPEASGEKGVCNCSAGYVSRWEGFIGWKIWADRSAITQRWRNDAERENVCVCTSSSILVSSDALCEETVTVHNPAKANSVALRCNVPTCAGKGAFCVFKMYRKLFLKLLCCKKKKRKKKKNPLEQPQKSPVVKPDTAPEYTSRLW